MSEPFDLDRPTHLLANDLLRRIEMRNSIQFQRETHADVEQLITQLRKALLTDAVRSAALIEAAKLVCMYCSGNAPHFFPAEPANNGSGNWVHRHKRDTAGLSRTLCAATAIHARIKFEAALNEPPFATSPTCEPED